MSFNTIYLAGPMEGVSVDEMNGWRRELVRLLESKTSFGSEGFSEPPPFKILDPTRRTTFHDKPTEDFAKVIFNQDLHDIDRSDICFFNMRRSGAKAWGTCMELMYAYTKGKIIIVLENADDPPHPFIEAMNTHKVYSLKAAADIICNYLE